MNRLSRLVVDPERLPDEHEQMYAVGMGADHTRTSGGLVLRKAEAHAEAALVKRFFAPYAEGLADLVDEWINEDSRRPATATLIADALSATRSPVCITARA